MYLKPKQTRSKKRIDIILKTAEEIILSEGIKSITIANISELSGLKRTSTYKFFPTPEDIKLALINRYVNNCAIYFKNESSNIQTEHLSVVVLRCVEILFDFFNANKASHELILKSSITLSIDSELLSKLSTPIQNYIESNIALPGMHNKDGIYRVLTQIILAIFSLNAKESGNLNETGKIEAHRAGTAYMHNWVEQNS